MASAAVSTEVAQNIPFTRQAYSGLSDPSSRRASLLSHLSIGSRSHESRPGSSAANPLHSRGGSIASLCTLSRSSFSTQIARLATVRLPQASTLQKAVSATDTSAGALKTLEDAARDIHRWIQNASEVLQELDAEDDIAWAAAAGREGVGEVDAAMRGFGELIQVYMAVVEQLQQRKNTFGISRKEMSGLLDQIEDIAMAWEDKKSKLQTIKTQVEVSLEWEELQSGVLNDIALEVHDLTKLTFEMEERRHYYNHGPGTATPTKLSDSGYMDVTSSPVYGSSPSAAPVTPLPLDFSKAPLTSENTNLLALLARMQPLRASLDFLPIRLSTFQQRAQRVFPSACCEIEERQALLEGLWERLDADVQSLRKELSEDRWLSIFRNAAKQAVRMIDSVNRSLTQVDESLDNNVQRWHAPMTLKKIESYQAKKAHYCPAIERVLDILAKGAKEQASVNGEVVRLQADARRRWESLRLAVHGLDTTLAEYEGHRQDRLQVRESISTVMSHERSRETSAERATPSTSPASSIHLAPSRKTSYQDLNLRRQASRNSLTSRISNTDLRNRFSSSVRDGEPLTPQYTPRPSMLPIRARTQAAFLSPTVDRHSEYPRTPVYNRLTSPSPVQSTYLPTPRSIDTRPARSRWNSSTKVKYAQQIDVTPMSPAEQYPSYQAASAGSGVSLSSPIVRTPLRKWPSRLSMVSNQSSATPASPFSLSVTPFANRSNRLEPPPSTPLSSSFSHSTGTPLRSRASMGPARLSSSYRASATPSTPRSGTSLGLRRDMKGCESYGLPTPQTGTLRPRWRV